MRELAQADPAEAELAEDGARPTAPPAPRVVAHREPLRARLLYSQRLLGHVLELPSSVCAREGHAEPGEQRLRLLVGLGGRGDSDVEAADGGDRVVVDLRKDDLLANSERIVAAPVERARVAPIGMPSRTLKLAIDFRARRSCAR